jgi:hypothetical protein
VGERVHLYSAIDETGKPVPRLARVGGDVRLARPGGTGAWPVCRRRSGFVKPVVDRPPAAACCGDEPTSRRGPGTAGGSAGRRHRPEKDRPDTAGIEALERSLVSSPGACTIGTAPTGRVATGSIRERRSAPQPRAGGRSASGSSEGQEPSTLVLAYAAGVSGMYQSVPS